MSHVVSEAVHVHLNNGLHDDLDDYYDDNRNDADDVDDCDGGDDDDDDDVDDDNPPHKYSFQHLHVRGQEPPKRSRCSAELDC